MDYINLRILLPVDAYLRLEDMARRFKVTENEILLDFILPRLASDEARLGHEKSAGFKKFYN